MRLELTSDCGVCHITLAVSCSTCKGSGGVGDLECGYCNGLGYQVTDQGQALLDFINSLRPAIKTGCACNHGGDDE